MNNIGTAGNAYFLAYLVGDARLDELNSAMIFPADGNKPYVTLLGFALGGTGVTLAAWVYTSELRPWARVWDFGLGEQGREFARETLTPENYWGAFCINGKNWPYFKPAGAAVLSSRFPNVEDLAITEQGIFAVGVWRHFAVTVTTGSSPVTTLYVDGVAVKLIGAPWAGVPSTPTTFYSAFLGRSNHGGDPYFAGAMAAFQQYNYAMTASQVAVIANGKAVR